jgi:hypothetical protein
MENFMNFSGSFNDILSYEQVSYNHIEYKAEFVKTLRIL